MMKKVALLAVFSTLMVPVSANAAFPGLNGKIAFTRGLQVYTINPDGSGEAQITNDSASKAEPHWSADGHRIAFVSSGPLGSQSLVTMDESGGSRFTVVNDYVLGLSWAPTGKALAYGTYSGVYPGHVIRINADGTGYTDLTDDPDDPYDGGQYPSWSPDGFRIAYAGLTSYPDNEGDFAPGSSGIWLTTPAGGFGTQLKGASDHEFYDEPDWSPGATKIVFSGTADPSCTAPACANKDLYVMNRDGTGLTKITSGVANDLDPAWSPDGTKIAFASAVAPPDPATCGSSDCNYEIFIINPDGSGLTRLTNNSVPDRWPDAAAARACLPTVHESEPHSWSAAVIPILQSAGANRDLGLHRHWGWGSRAGEVDRLGRAESEGRRIRASG
jgi:Tol biopolymer transport system component